MSFKQLLLDTIDHEVSIYKHLYAKLPEGALDYRPSASQRSTAELLRYMTYAALGASRAMVDGHWDAFQELSKAAENAAADTFPRAMDEQRERLHELYGGLSDDDLLTRTATLPWGEEVPLGRALTTSGVSFLVAYRMQLFLYAKAAGATELSTADCWAGVEMPQTT